MKDEQTVFKCALCQCFRWQVSLCATEGGLPFCNNPELGGFSALAALVCSWQIRSEIKVEQECKCPSTADAHTLLPLGEGTVRNKLTLKLKYKPI